MAWWDIVTNAFHKQKRLGDPEAPIKSLMRNAPTPGGQLGDNIRMKRELLGSYKKGGVVKKTGAYRLHKGEVVVPKKKAMAKKMHRD